MRARVRWCVVVLGCVLACREVEKPAAPPQEVQKSDVLATPEPETPAGELPTALRGRILHYKATINRGRYSEGLAEIRETLPDLERFVERNPASADGQVELAGAYTVMMFVAATKLPPGQEVTAIMAEGVEKDYFGRAIRALDAFETYSARDDPRRKAAAEIRKLLDEIRARALGAGTANCSEEVLRLCRRVESGEAPAKTYGTYDVHEILERVEGCLACESFPHIESTVLPAAKKMIEVLDKLRSEQR